MSILNALSKQYKDSVLQLQMTGKAGLEKELKDFFTKNLVITAIRWRQYTTYFNDGDECHFNVHDLQYKIMRSTVSSNCQCGATLAAKDKFCSQCGRAAESAINESDWLDSYELKKEKISRLDAELAEIKALNLGSSHEDILRILFGDHVEITATAAGLQVQEYTDHE